jgi:SAM-dependent methyltransferase
LTRLRALRYGGQELCGPEDEIAGKSTVAAYECQLSQAFVGACCDANVRIAALRLPDDRIRVAPTDASIVSIGRTRSHLNRVAPVGGDLAAGITMPRRMDALLERTFQAEQRHFWFRGFKKFVAPLIEEATAGLTRPRLLDAGCGTGANLTFLANYGVPFGIELFWRGLQFGRGRGLKRLVQGSVTHLPCPSDSVDVVLSFDVLYCLQDNAEQAAIAEMFRVLRPGGSVVVNVAALEMLKGDHSALGGEVRRYTTGELRDKLERAGFRVERITYTNASLFPLTAAVRAMQRMRGVKPVEESEGDFLVPPAPINALFSAVLSIESKLIGLGINMPIGSSVLCLARKP